MTSLLNIYQGDNTVPGNKENKKEHLSIFIYKTDINLSCNFVHRFIFVAQLMQHDLNFLSNSWKLDKMQGKNRI